MSRLLDEGLWLALRASAPVLGAALLAGALSAIVLGMWKVDDGALRALPRLVLGWLVIALAAGYASHELVAYTRGAYTGLFELAR